MNNHRQMRRKNRELDEDQVKEILQNGLYGILGTAALDGSPYAPPMSYVYENGVIYFHAFNAKTGESHKLDNIRENNKVCFTVVSMFESATDDFATNYRSVVAFGKAELVDDADAKNRALMSLARKYQPHLIEKAPDYIQKSGDMVCIVKMSIDHVTGKGNA